MSIKKIYKHLPVNNNTLFLEGGGGGWRLINSSFLGVIIKKIDFFFVSLQKNWEKNRLMLFIYMIFECQAISLPMFKHFWLEFIEM